MEGNSGNHLKISDFTIAIVFSFAIDYKQGNLFSYNNG
ncbi:hypothetical protein BH10BAC3_BH10BAC3_04430 [soil metagenome]